VTHKTSLSLGGTHLSFINQCNSSFTIPENQIDTPARTLSKNLLPGLRRRNQIITPTFSWLMIRFDRKWRLFFPQKLAANSQIIHSGKNLSFYKTGVARIS
ncbi:hypothetical protein, partial [Succinimonas amylolytica]|uniref:hypothetical protein n=1 Tax=Succinimonas amylolytica TaxID=83769 RepID=UPI0023A7D05D